MNSIVRSIQAFGLDLSLSVLFGDHRASAVVAFEGHAPQGPRLWTQDTCHDSVVHDLTVQVHELMERAYQQYRAARLCQWTVQLVAPVGPDFQLSVFDQWMLEKLMTCCPHFQLGWTLVQDDPAAFRLMRDGSSLRIQVKPVSDGTSCFTSVVTVSDVHSLIQAARHAVSQGLANRVSAEAAD